MKVLRVQMTLGVFWIGLHTAVCFADNQTATAKITAQVPPGASANTEFNNVKERSATPETLSKVYMNCMIEVDRSLAVLAQHAKSKAVQAEEESQRAFCANRKRDCQRKPESAECRTFVEEFSDMGSLGENLGKH